MIRPVFGDAGYRTDESLGQSAGCSANLYPYYPGRGLQGHYATAEPWGGNCKAMPSTVTRLQALASPPDPCSGLASWAGTSAVRKLPASLLGALCPYLQQAEGRV